MRCRLLLTTGYWLLLPIPQMLAQARVLLGEEEREALGFEHVEAAHDFGERQLVLEVDLIVEVCAQAVFPRLPVLRHHDERSLHPSDDGEDEVEEYVRVRVEDARAEQD